MTHAALCCCSRSAAAACCAAARTRMSTYARLTRIMASCRMHASCSHITHYYSQLVATLASRMLRSLHLLLPARTAVQASYSLCDEHLGLCSIITSPRWPMPVKDTLPVPISSNTCASCQHCWCALSTSAISVFTATAIRKWQHCHGRWGDAHNCSGCDCHRFLCTNIHQFHVEGR